MVLTRSTCRFSTGSPSLADQRRPEFRLLFGRLKQTNKSNQIKSQQMEQSNLKKKIWKETKQLTICLCKAIFSRDECLGFGAFHSCIHTHSFNQSEELLRAHKCTTWRVFTWTYGEHCRRGSAQRFEQIWDENW